MLSWTSLGSLLSSTTSRVIYTLPVAGYVILYSDYFRNLHMFSTLTHGGFLTFSERVNLFYYGSLMLLLAYGLWWVSSPRLLRGKQDLQQFISDIVVARDRATVIVVARSAPFTPQSEREHFSKTLTADDQTLFGRIAVNLEVRGAGLGEAAGEYEHLIPTALGFYFKRQNGTRRALRIFTGGFTILGFSLVLLPSLDLLFRVLSTHYRLLFG
jgi:hypothetical protein